MEGNFGFGTKGIGGIVIVNDKNFVMQQTSLSTVWSVPHNLNKRCSIQITNDSFHEIEGDIRWIDNNSVEITFNKPTKGWVYCN